MMSFARTDLKQLRWQYGLLVNTLLVFCGLLAAVPGVLFAIWLGYYLGVPMLRSPLRSEPIGSLPWIAHRLGVEVLYGPVHNHVHEAVFWTLWFATLILFLLVSYLIIFGSMAVVLCWRGSLSSRQAYQLVFRSEAPMFWRKPPPPA